ncbi:hydroxymethylbilane synthase [Dissulfurirhabdus thermomarina]|uniref:Porphobilinogen deaminase n=1 Tax=Dissulfurirhabdus thermomarina TaxID=1765737 RepID=A0A6N9TR57_DISTH|nr:hydroxymethylbilane synthase [Dissulfurirhabdus thermomarina]NDY42930.1 hydroxymethylbilane synthase [Dissulfurirhabdus thermomarina]NMX23216.1 hydroxymethylbilane synthase [Dissulfurirhabdus thermomarina]
MPERLRLATRKSALALAQSTWVKEQIEARWPGVEVELVRVVTKGDKILDVPLAKVGGKGLFVKEIEEALLRGEADLAVHSLKDVPAETPEGLEVSVFPRREDPRDALVARPGLTLETLPEGARVGTSSLRRMAQLRLRRPDLEIHSLRGNLDTRLRKLDEGAFDAILLAVAGLRRLGLADRITEVVDAGVLLPAVGQGALGIELRSNDPRTREILAPLADTATATCVRAERAFLARLEGGCQVPIGGLARLDGDRLSMEGLVADEAGRRIVRRNAEGPAADAARIGRDLADEILEAGGREILAEVYGHA